MRRYFVLLREHHAMSATKTIAMANAAARPTAEARVVLGMGRDRAKPAGFNPRAQCAALETRLRPAALNCRCGSERGANYPPWRNRARGPQL